MARATTLALTQNVPASVWWAGAALFIGALFTSNAALTCASIAVFLVLLHLLWRPAEPPVLFYAMAYQWLQATILVFSADLQGIPLDGVDAKAISLQGRVLDVDLEPATWLTLAGLLAVAIGMRLAAGRSVGLRLLPKLAESTAQLSINKLLIASLAAMGAGSVLASLASRLGGLSQVAIALANLHWVFFFVFVYAVLTQRRGYAALAFIFTVEVLIGFLGFFSEFKTVLVVSLLAALAVPLSLRGRRLWIAGLIAALALVLGVVWSAIKIEYRSFANAGTGDQVVVVSKTDQIAELHRLISELDKEDLSRGATNLVGRLTYVYFLSEVMHMVPAYIAHEDGALWGDALYRAVVPRLLDPDKPIVDDTARTQEYTGLAVIGADSGTSVSLGYMAESYIDFGPVFMMLPLFLWGLLVGAAYRSFVSRTCVPLLGYGCATITVMTIASVLEMSNAKMIAGLLLGWLTLWAVVRYAGPTLVQKVRTPLRDAPRPPATRALQ